MSQKDEFSKALDTFLLVCFSVSIFTATRFVLITGQREVTAEGVALFTIVFGGLILALALGVKTILEHGK